METLARGSSAHLSGTLEHIKGAKQLNPQQAQCALFFTRFNFVVTYHPGSKNSKADTLLLRHKPVHAESDLEPILGPTVIVAPIRWDIMEEIHQAQQGEDPPTECPPGRLYVPASSLRHTIKWVHSAHSTGHPGVNQTTQLLRNTFWWPSLATDVKMFINFCTTCTQRAFFERLDINESLTSSCHPQSNGQVESLNQELGRYLRTYCHKEQLRWSEFLPWAEYAQNSLTHTSSELTLDDWFHQSQEVWESAH
ncbi:hypothetical protein QTP86_033681, partial [Hemibagrus guttatus]